MTVTIHPAQPTPLAESLLARWRRIPVSVAVDLAPDRQIDPAIKALRPAGLQPALFGRAVTARCDPPDFGAVLHALELVEPGNVPIVNAGPWGRDYHTRLERLCVPYVRISVKMNSLTGRI